MEQTDLKKEHQIAFNEFEKWNIENYTDNKEINEEKLYYYSQHLCKTNKPKTISKKISGIKNYMKIVYNHTFDKKNEYMIKLKSMLFYFFNYYCF